MGCCEIRFEDCGAVGHQRCCHLRTLIMQIRIIPVRHFDESSTSSHFSSLCERVCKLVRSESVRRSVRLPIGSVRRSVQFADRFSSQISSVRDSSQRISSQISSRRKGSVRVVRFSSCAFWSSWLVLARLAGLRWAGFVGLALSDWAWPG